MGERDGTEDKYLRMLAQLDILLTLFLPYFFYSPTRVCSVGTEQRESVVTGRSFRTREREENLIWSF